MGINQEIKKYNEKKLRKYFAEPKILRNFATANEARQLSWLERRIHNPEVTSSTLVPATKETIINDSFFFLYIHVLK